MNKDKNKNNKKIVILGAGLTGLSAAYSFLERECQVTVYEKNAVAGGLCSTNYVNGYSFDYAGHWFHTRDKRVQEILNKLVINLEKVNRKTGIFIFDTIIEHPFQTNLYGLPTEVVTECLIEFFKSYYTSQKKEYISFEEWIYCTLGEGIAKYFMIPYNKKLWTVSPNEMTCDWMGRFLPRANPNDIVKGALAPRTNTLSYNSSFLYPKKGGIQSLINQFAKVVKVKYKHKVNRIDINDKKIYFENGVIEQYDILINSIPLKELLEITTVRNVNVLELAEKLRHNSLLNINIGVSEEDVIERKHWVYFPEDDIPFFRVGSYSNVQQSMVPPKKGSLYLEIAYNPLTHPNLEKIQEESIKALVKKGYISFKNIEVVQSNEIKYAYVIYDHNHRSITSKLKQFLMEHEIYSIGRYGAWEYSSMEDAIIWGLTICEKIIGEI